MLEILKIRNRGGQSGWSLLGRREKRGREIGVDGVNAVEIFASAIDSSFTFLELSGIFCSQIFLIHGWLNLQMQNLWIQRVNRGRHESRSSAGNNPGAEQAGITQLSRQ